MNINYITDSKRQFINNLHKACPILKKIIPEKSAKERNEDSRVFRQWM